VENTEIARASKRTRELTFHTAFGDLTLFQQAQSGDA
ncbi:4Fe-4S dicluster domain-containing protein, partial [Salmonella enterica subsp. enterica serovar Infantis]